MCKQFANVQAICLQMMQSFIGILSDEDMLSSLVYVHYKNGQMKKASRCKSVYYGRNINHNYVYNYVLCRIVYTILTCRYCKNVNFHMHLRTASC